MGTLAAPTRAFLMVLCCACGDDAQPRERSGAPRTARVRDLSEQDAYAFCRWMVERMAEIEDPTADCTHSAALASATAAECDAQRQACLQNLSPQESLELQLMRCEGIAGSSFYVDCAAPVGLIEDCLFETLDLVETRRALSCDDAGPSLAASYSEPEQPSCEPLWSECFP